MERFTFDEASRAAPDGPLPVHPRGPRAAGRRHRRQRTLKPTTRAGGNCPGPAPVSRIHGHVTRSILIGADRSRRRCGWRVAGTRRRPGRPSGVTLQIGLSAGARRRRGDPVRHAGDPQDELLRLFAQLEMVSFMNRTEPSMNPTFAPPGRMLNAASTAGGADALAAYTAPSSGD